MQTHPKFSSFQCFPETFLDENFTIIRCESYKLWQPLDLWSQLRTLEVVPGAGALAFPHPIVQLALSFSSTQIQTISTQHCNASDSGSSLHANTASQGLAYFVAAICKGVGRQAGSKLTQGFGFHRRHVLGHNAWTPNRDALIGQFKGGRFKLFQMSCRK